MSAMSIAATGIYDATVRFDASARRTANAPLNNMAEEAVERIKAEVALKANVSVIRAASETTGTLLDMLA
jgi:flagellar basal body rod protein FlgC